jgi:hypothetical protein
VSAEVEVDHGRDAAKEWGETLSSQDFVVLPGPDLTAAIPAGTAELVSYWDSLDRDDTLLDGGNYRERRYGRVNAHEDSSRRWSFSPLPHIAFRQDAEFIPQYRGQNRLFSPIQAAALLHPVLLGLVRLDLDIVSASGNGAPDWEIGLHMIRVIAGSAAQGLPTPEGRHRDGHDFIGMHLIRREHCSGGETTIYRSGQEPLRLTLVRQLDSLVVTDTLITHEVSPIMADGGIGVRDMLLVDLTAR